MAAPVQAPPPIPHRVASTAAPADAGSLGLPLAWQEEVVDTYVARGQPESILEFVSASLRSCAPVDRPSGDFALLHALGAYAAAQRTDALLHCYASSPWELRSPAVQSTVLLALARAGRVADVEAVCAGDKRYPQPHPLLRAPLLLAHAAAGDFEGALSLARALAGARACVLSGAPAEQGGEGRAPLSSSLFDALIEAAGLAGAPHYARAVFECLTLHDLGHAASLGAQISHTSAALSMGLPSRDAAASAVMLEAQKAVRDEMRAALDSGGQAEGSSRPTSPLDAYLASVASGQRPPPAAAAAAASLPSSLARAAQSAPAPTAAAAAASRLTLFASLFCLREVGEAAPTPATYTALIRAYAHVGDTLQAQVALGLLKGRVALERDAAARESRACAWSVPAGAFEGLLEAHFVESERALLAGARAEACSAPGSPPAAPPQLPPLDVATFENSLTDMDTKVRPLGRSATAVGLVAGGLALRGRYQEARACRDANGGGAPTAWAPAVTEGMLRGCCSRARAALARGDHDSLEAACEHGMAFWTEWLRASERTRAFPTAGLTAAALTLAALGGHLGLCEHTVRVMEEAEIEPTEACFTQALAALQATAGQGMLRRVGVLARALERRAREASHSAAATAALDGAAGVALACAYARVAAECSGDASPATTSAHALQALPPAPTQRSLEDYFRAIPLLALGSGSAAGELGRALLAALDSQAFARLAAAHDIATAPAGLRALESLTARRVHEAVAASSALLTLRAAGESSAPGAQLPPLPLPAHEEAAQAALAAAVCAALQAFGAVVGAADSAEQAAGLFSAATAFLRSNASLVRAARAHAGEAAARELATAAPACRRRAALQALLAPHQAPYAGLLRFAARAPPGLLRVTSVCGPEVQAAPLSLPMVRLAGAYNYAELPCGAGGATLAAWARLCDTDCVGVSAEALSLGLRSALVHAPHALQELETHTLPLLLGAGRSALAGASPLGPLLPSALTQTTLELWAPSLLLNDMVLPLRLAAGSIVRGGALVLSLWEAYAQDKVEIVRGGGDGLEAPGILRLACQGRAAATPMAANKAQHVLYPPFSPTLPREGLSVYLAALATVASSGGSAEDSDALTSEDDLPPPHVAAASMQQALAPHLALAHGRATVCTMAESGSLPNLEDLLSLVRLYASAGLLPDARLLVRMLLAPSLRRDYTQAALEKDAESDSRKLAATLGAANPEGWHAWPGQGEVLTLGVSTSGLAFGAPHPAALFDLHVKAAVQACADACSTQLFPLTLNSCVFALIATALGATGLCDELLPYLIEAGVEQEEALARRGLRHVILDTSAAIAVYAAWAMVGSPANAEAVLTDPRFSLSCKGAQVIPEEELALRDAALSSILRMPANLASQPPFAPLLAPHLPWALPTPAVVTNTLRVYAALHAGGFHRALRLAEGALQASRGIPSARASTPAVQPRVMSALLSAASRLAQKTLLLEPAGDSPTVREKDPYSTARRLLEGVQSAAPTQVRSGGPMCLLAQLEALARVFSGQDEYGARFWSICPSDLSNLVRLYGLVGRVEVGAALAWGQLARGLAKLIDTVTVQLDSSSPPRNLPQLHEVTLLHREVLTLAGEGTDVRLPPLAPGLERARSIGDSALAQAHAVAATWGLPPAGSGSAVAHPRPASDSPMPGGAHPMSLALPSLVDALAGLFAVASPALYAERRIAEHSISTLLSAAAMLNIVITPPARTLLGFSLARCRASGSFPPDGLAKAEALASTIVPSLPCAWVYPALTATVLCSLPVCPAPPDNVLEGGQLLLRGGTRVRPDSSSEALVSTLASPAHLLSPTLALSALATVGYPLRGPSAAAPIVRTLCEDARTLAAHLAMAFSAPKPPPVHSAAAIGDLYSATVKAFYGLDPPKPSSQAPPPQVSTSPSPSPSPFRASHTALTAFPSSGILTPAAPFGSSPEDASLRSMENEIIGLQTELRALEESTGKCEDTLLRQRQRLEGALGSASALLPMPRPEYCQWQGLSAAARADQLRAILATLEAHASALQDEIALDGSGARERLVAYSSQSSDLDAALAGAKSALSAAVASLSSLEAGFAESKAQYDACLEAVKLYTYSARARSAAAEQAERLEGLVLGPPSIHVIGAQTVRLLTENRLAALLREAEVGGRHDAAIWALEATALAHGDEVAAARARIATAEAKLASLSAVGVLGEEESRLRDLVRGWKARGEAAVRSSALHAEGGPWSHAREKVATLRGAATAAAARLELNRRALVTSRMDVAIDEERAAGTRMLCAIKENFRAECESITGEYSDKCDIAVELLRGALGKEMEPLEASAAEAARLEDARLGQLRREVSAMEAELGSLMDSNSALLGLGSRRSEKRDALTGVLMENLEETITLGDSAEAARAVFNVLDDLVPCGMDALSVGSLLGVFEEATRA